MNIGDRLESGYNNSLSLEDLNQISVRRVATQLQSKETTIDRLLGSVRSFSGKPLDVDDRVASVIERYVTYDDRNGNREWVNYIQRELKFFRSISVKKQYDLEMTIVEYHVDELRACKLKLYWLLLSRLEAHFLKLRSVTKSIALMIFSGSWTRQ